MKPLNERMIDLAYSWHGGQWSPLYSFASTGGTVYSEDHRVNLLREIEGNISWCERHPNSNEAEEDLLPLQQLRDWVKDLPAEDRPHSFQIEV